MEATRLGATSGSKSGHVFFHEVSIKISKGERSLALDKLLELHDP